MPSKKEKDCALFVIFIESGNEISERFEVREQNEHGEKIVSLCEWRFERFIGIRIQKKKKKKKKIVFETVVKFCPTRIAESSEKSIYD